MNKISRDIQFLRKAPYTPVRGILRTLIERRFEDLLNSVIIMATRLSATGRIRQTGHPISSKAQAPLGDRLLAGLVSFCNLFA